MIKRFVEFVQLPAKTACLLPFLLALFYTLYTYRQINVWNTIVFFVSMLAFELLVTGLNSYIDTKSNGMQLQFARKTAKRILIVLFVVAVAAGILLVFRAGLIVLAIGGLCFLVGILYSWGPASISRMPLGEVFSGGFEGFVLPFLVVFVNAPQNSLLGYSLSGWVLQVTLNISGIFRLFVLMIPAMFGIANIMLANNICDVEADTRVGRHTLPYHLGRRNSLRLFAAGYYVAFATILLTAVLGILPPYVLVALITIILVQRNISVFKNVQSKTETFPYSVKNFIALMGPLILVAAVAAFIRF